MLLSDQFCSVPGCMTKVGPKGAKGLCNRHYIQLRRKGGVIDADILSDLPGEEWSAVDGTEHVVYMVSNLGRVMSLNGSKKMLKTYYHQKNGVQCNVGGYKTLLIASEVIRAFKPNPFHDRRWLYLDGNRHNCTAENLEWYGVFWFEKSLKALKAEDNEDARDIVAFMEGDNDAINRILAERTGKIIGLIKMKLTFYRSIYKNTHNIDVEAIAQDVLMVAVRAIRRGLLRRTESISGWFGKIAQNTLKNACRKRTLSEVDMYGTYSDSGEEYDNSDRAVYSEWMEKERYENVGL